MANFNLYAPKIREFEGFYSHDKGDSGHLTIFGLTIVHDKSWKGWDIVLPLYGSVSPTADEVGSIFKSEMLRKLTPFKEQLWQLAIPFYKQKYWDKVGGDNIQSQELAEIVTDEAINAGIGTALALLKKSTNA